MINTGTGNKVVNDDFLHLLLTLKQSTMRATNVAEVCQVTGVFDDHLSCRILSSGITIDCYSMNGVEAALDDIVVVLFTDTDFRPNLKRIKNNRETQTFEQEDLHTKDCGIIIGILYRGEEL